MVCLYCGHDTQVVNSRPQKRTNSIWRRRKCVSCGNITTSIESIDYSQALRVRRTISGSSILAPFERDLLLLSIHDSLRHRPTAPADATALTTTIITRLHPLIEHAIIEREHIIAVAADVLEKFDPVAATHYQAFHK